MSDVRTLSAEIRYPPADGSGDVRTQVSGTCSGEARVEVYVSNPNFMPTQAKAFIKTGNTTITDQEIQTSGQVLDGPMYVSGEFLFQGWVPGARCKGDGACSSSPDSNTLGVMIRWERLMPPESYWERATTANHRFSGKCVSSTPPTPLPGIGTKVAATQVVVEPPSLTGDLLKAIASGNAVACDAPGVPMPDGWLFFQQAPNTQLPGMRLVHSNGSPLRGSEIECYGANVNWYRFGDQNQAMRSSKGNRRIALDYASSTANFLGYPEGGLLLIQRQASHASSAVHSVESDDSSHPDIIHLDPARDVFLNVNSTTSILRPHVGSAGIMIRIRS